MAVSWNFALALIIGGLPAITASWLAKLDGASVTAVLRSPAVMIGILAATVFLALGFALRTSALRAYFARVPESKFSEATPHS